MVQRACKIAPAIQHFACGGELLIKELGVRRTKLCDLGRHRRIFRQQIGEHRQQRVANIVQLADANIQVEHAQKFAVRTGIGHQRRATGILDRHRLRNGIMRVSAQDHIDAGHPAGQLQIDVHAIMRQHHNRIRLILAARLIDDLLHVAVTDAEGPIRHKSARMGDRDIREALADHRKTATADFLDHIRTEHPPTFLIEHLGAVQRGLIRGKHVLGNIAALELRQVGAELLGSISHLKMRGHRIDAQQIADLDHRFALGSMCHPRALPCVTAIEQHRVGRSRF